MGTPFGKHSIYFGDDLFINFDRQKFKDFKNAYNKAVESKEPGFVFEMISIEIDYAKYVIEFLEDSFKKH